MQYATKAAASTSAAGAVRSQVQLKDAVLLTATDTSALLGYGGREAPREDRRIPSVQTEDIDNAEPISLHFRHAGQVVSVKAGSIAHDLTLFMPKRNEVFSIHIPHSGQVLYNLYESI